MTSVDEAIPHTLYMTEISPLSNPLLEVFIVTLSLERHRHREDQPFRVPHHFTHFTITSSLHLPIPPPHVHYFLSHPMFSAVILPS